MVFGPVTQTDSHNFCVPNFVLFTQAKTILITGHKQQMFKFFFRCSIKGKNFGALCKIIVSTKSCYYSSKIHYKNLNILWR